MTSKIYEFKNGSNIDTKQYGSEEAYFVECRKRLDRIAVPSILMMNDYGCDIKVYVTKANEGNVDFILTNWGFEYNPSMK